MRVELALLLFAAAGTAVTGAEHPLSLEEAIARALQKNEGILVQREGLEAARAAERGARGIYDPALSLEGGWRRVSEPVNSTFSGAPAGEAAPTFSGAEASLALEQFLPTGGTVSVRASGLRQTSDGTFALLSPSYATRLGFELRQPLLLSLASHPSRVAIRVAALDRDRAAASLQQEIADTVAAVERAYWTLAAARREVGVRDEAVRLAGEQLEQTRIRVEQGVSAQAELAQPRAELERRRGDLLASREAVARAESALKRLILGDGEQELWLATLMAAEGDAVDAIPIDVAGWMDKALGARPEIHAARAAVEQRRLEARLARNRTRPGLEAVAAYDRFGLAGSANPEAAPPPGVPFAVPPGLQGGWGRSFSTLREGDFSNARVGIVLKLPIGNRTARASAAVAQSIERQAEAQLEQTRKAVRADVLDAAAALQTAEQRVSAARAAREAAEVQLSSERDRFGAGLSTNFLVLTRQNDLSRARLEEIASLHDYRTARTALARATGSLLEERRIEIEPGPGEGSPMQERKS